MEPVIFNPKFGIGDSVFIFDDENEVVKAKVKQRLFLEVFNEDDEDEEDLVGVVKYIVETSDYSKINREEELVFKNKDEILAHIEEKIKYL